MPPRFSPAAVMVALVAFPGSLLAQSVAAGDSALARGDTAAAIAAYEAATKRHLDDAEAHYRAGMLLLARVAPGNGPDDNRRRAEEHFRYAVRFQGDSVKYLVAMADHNGGGLPSSDDLIRRAAELARKHPAVGGGEVEWRAAQLEWGKYEQNSHHYLFSGDSALLDVDFGYDNWNYIRRFATAEVTPDKGNPAEGAARAVETDLRSAIQFSPKFLRPAALLVVLLGDQDRWTEAVDVARRLTAVAPDSGLAWALLGLTQARSNRWADAQSSYDSAFQHMSDAERVPYDNLAYVLTPGQQERWAQTAPGDRRELAAAFWASAQPLFMTNLNEARTEYYARVTWATTRWTDIVRGYQGSVADAGLVYLRYGQPDLWINLGGSIHAVGTGDRDLGLNDFAGSDTAQFRSQRSTTPGGDFGQGGMGQSYLSLWVYFPIRRGFAFRNGRGRMTFVRTESVNYADLYREASSQNALRLDNVPIERDLDTIDVQAVQFRADDPTRTDLAVYSLVPVGRMLQTSHLRDVDLQTAMIVKGNGMRDVYREPRQEHVTTRDSTQIERRFWRTTLRPGRYPMHIEAMMPATDRAARGAEVLDIRSFAGDTLLMSDIVVARNLAPKDSAPHRWTDLIVDPSTGRLGPNEPVGLMWETYNLTPDSAGTVRYHVELRITVKSVERHGFVAEILGGIGDAIGLTARGDDAAALGFNRSAPAARNGAQVEYLTLNLRGAPSGIYDVEVQVTDKVSNRVVSELRHLTVTPTKLER